MKSCELCKSPAKIYCDSDQANLCWTCDNKVHSANFLVARHSRTLLCRVCQSQTPWTATGEKLGPSAGSVCQKCLLINNTSDYASDYADDINKSEEEYDDEDDEYDEDSETQLDVEVEDADDNQVVPLSHTPPPAVSSSSSDDNYYYSVGDRDVLVKRKRVNEADTSTSEDDVECLSGLKSHRIAIEGNGGILYNFMPLKSEGMGEKLNNNRNRDRMNRENESGAIIGECEATRTFVLDLNSSDS